MIIRMAKVEVVGPRNLLEEALGLFQEAHALELDQELGSFVPEDRRHELHALQPEGQEFAELLSLNLLRTKVLELLGMLPPEPEERKSYLSPEAALDTLGHAIDRQIEDVRGMRRRREELNKEAEELDIFRRFFLSLSHMYQGLAETHGMEFLGVRLKMTEAVGTLRGLLGRLTEERFELVSEPLADGSAVALVLVPKSEGDKVRAALGKESIPELGFPATLASLSFADKLNWLQQRATELQTEAGAINSRLTAYAHRWRPIYTAVLKWLETRLSMLSATAQAYRTGECFFLYGWMPEANVLGVSQRLEARFGGRVLLSTLELRERDMSRVPVALWNPRWLRPFELFTRLLPLPRYTSYDPTPFLALFFPLFFGLVLGDVGYGLVLASICAVLLRRAQHPMLREAATVFLIASVYSIFFGFLYGEVFGGLGRSMTGFMPVHIDREHSVLPMLGFALALGLFHILLGFTFGIISALRAHETRKAIYKAGSVLALLIIAIFVSGRAGLIEPIAGWYLGLALILASVALVIGEGALGLLELLRSIGNIVSYARLMALGLTSVLLAYVANRLGGLMGDVLLGALVGGLLHALNLVLGVFSPTIHSIRLHYVEFFDKFIEHGGRPFRPLK